MNFEIREYSKNFEKKLNFQGQCFLMITIIKAFLSFLSFYDKRFKNFKFLK